MNSTPSSATLMSRLAGSRTDRLLLLLALAAITFGWMHVRQLAGGGRAMVDIYHGRTLLAEYPLHAPHPVHFAAKGEIGTSEVDIADGTVAITDSPCRGKQCVLSGHKHRVGDMIVCLPNRIMVAIRGDAKAFDAVLE